MSGDRRMTAADWSGVRHFRPAEFGAWSDRMSHRLILQLDEWRDALGCPVHVNSSGRTTSGPELVGVSQHVPDRDGIVRAVDVSPACSIVTAYLAAERYDWPGLGLYYNPAFLHLDVRDVAAGRGARWARWGPEGTPYRDLDSELLEAVQVAERTKGVYVASFSSVLLGALVVIALLNRE